MVAQAKGSAERPIMSTPMGATVQVLGCLVGQNLWVDVGFGLGLEICWTISGKCRIELDVVYKIQLHKYYIHNSPATSTSNICSLSFHPNLPTMYRSRRLQMSPRIFSNSLIDHHATPPSLSKSRTDYILYIIAIIKETHSSD